MEFGEFVNNKDFIRKLPEGAVLWNVGAEQIPSEGISLSKMNSIILVLRGEMRMDMEGKLKVARTNDLVELHHRKATLISTSKDIVAWCLLMDENFFLTVFDKQPPFPAEYVLRRKRNAVTLLPSPLFRLLYIRVRDLDSLFKDENHLFRVKMVRYVIAMMIFEIANVFIQQNDLENKSDTTRKEFLFMRFMKLLDEHVTKERSVNYYASCLCISSQYLGRIVNMYTGQGAHQWIAKRLMPEVKRLMRNPELSFQQIAENLNFPDQATFSKYIKKQSGMSPTEYRKSL